MDRTNSTKSFFLKSCSTNTGLHHNQPPAEMVVSYKECLKNHAATIGGHALDGCGEFMPTPTATPTDPTSLRCAACGCHRNFHRRDPYEGPTYIHHQPPPLSLNPSSSPSPSPSSSPNQTPSSPVPYSYYSSAPHMLLALSTAYSGRSDETHHHHHPNSTKTENGSGGRKRSRTKFSEEQKEKMYEFAEKLGWRMPRNEEKLVEEFCGEIGITRVILKVWMHNHKQNLGKREMGTENSNSCPDN